MDDPVQEAVPKESSRDETTSTMTPKPPDQARSPKHKPRWKRKTKKQIDDKYRGYESLLDIEDDVPEDEVPMPKGL